MYNVCVDLHLTKHPIVNDFDDHARSFNCLYTELIVIIDNIWCYGAQTKGEGEGHRAGSGDALQCSGQFECQQQKKV